MEELTYEEWCAISYAVVHLNVWKYGDVDMEKLREKVSKIAETIQPQYEED